MGTTPLITHLHHASLHLVPFCQLCFVFVSCVHSRVVKGSWEGIAGCVMNVDQCVYMLLVDAM